MCRLYNRYRSEGDAGGGEVVATGSPEEIADIEMSYTGKYVKRYL